MGEAIHILLSNDQLLNSKNEYIQNCIARVTVQEDLYERKARMLKEEEEERKLEMEIMEFKSRKKNDKRKPEENHQTFHKDAKRLRMDQQNSSREGEKQVQPDRVDNMADPPEREVGRKTSREEGFQVPGVVSEGVDMADPPEREVGKGSSQEEEEQVQKVDQAQDGKKETSSSPEAGKARLRELRKRMESERLAVIKYLENKKKENKRLEPFIPDGWMEWWKGINFDEENQIKKEKKLQQAGRAKKTFQELVLPNQALVGWRGWWNRMEAESRKDGKEKMKLEVLNKAKERMKPLETYFKNLKTKMESSGNIRSGIFSSSQTSSPKRKLLTSSSFIEPSPGKKRKLNFRENLSFWQTLEGEGDTHSKHGPTNTAVRKNFEAKISHTNKHHDLEVVIGQDGPGGNRGLSGRKLLPGGGLPKGLYIFSMEERLYSK